MGSLSRFKLSLPHCNVPEVLNCMSGRLSGFPRGPFKCYVTQMGVGGVRFSRKKHYEGVMFNVISVTRGWVGVQFAENSVT